MELNAPVFDAHFVPDLQALKISRRPADRIIVNGHKIVEQVIIREDGREQLAIIVSRVRRHRFAIHQNRPRLRRIETQQEFDQRRLARAVLADDKHDLAPPDREIDRPEGESNAVRI